MKKMIRFTAMVLMLLFLCGCSPSGYKLIQENGNYYIQLAEKSSDSEGELPGSVSGGSSHELHAVSFDSLEEMRKDIQTGNFTEEEMYHIQHCRGRDGIVEIGFNLDELYDIIPPEEGKKRIIWRLNANSYGYDISYKYDTFSFQAKSVTKEEFENAFKSIFNYWDNTSEAAKDCGEKITVQTHEGSKRSFVYYMTTIGNVSVYIRETLHDDGSLEDGIRVLWEENGFYFTAAFGFGSIERTYPESFYEPDYICNWVAQCEVNKYESE